MSTVYNINDLYLSSNLYNTLLIKHRHSTLFSVAGINTDQKQLERQKGLYFHVTSSVSREARAVTSELEAEITELCCLLACLATFLTQPRLTSLRVVLLQWARPSDINKQWKQTFTDMPKSQSDGGSFLIQGLSLMRKFLNQGSLFPGDSSLLSWQKLASTMGMCVQSASAERCEKLLLLWRGSW